MDKKELRLHIKNLKKQHSKEALKEQSELILNKLEENNLFIESKTVMLYSSLPDEVQTHDFLEKWRHEKKIILPTVVGDDIIPVELSEETEFAVGDFNILEPQNKPYDGDYDLIVVPDFKRYPNSTSYDMECSLVKNELERVAYFASLASNYHLACESIQDMLDYYNLEVSTLIKELEKQ